MNIKQAVEKALEEPSLLDSLSFLAAWEGDRAIKQARHFFKTGERTGANNAGWDTCYRATFKALFDELEKHGTLRDSS